ncbi:protein kinase domain-containing protein [Ditylenchus destructor]|nr:protein kinase domain-containing protein [Ditylenchus destructor]
MASIVLIFLTLLHLIAQVYAPAVDQSLSATGPKLVQPAAATGPKLVQPPATTGPKPKYNTSQANSKPVSKEWVVAPTMPKYLSKVAKQFYKKHASILTPGVTKSDFKVQKHLSTGDDGSVYIVLRIKDNAKFALKEMDLTPATNFSELAEQIDIQVQATKDKRTHINNVFAVFLDQNKICMILELMKGDVDDEIIGTSIKLTEKEFCVMAKGMMEDLAYLEEKGISHRDLDTCNLFVNQKNEIVIGDFQRATKQREFSCIYHAWPHYAPPEWKRTDIKCTIKVDVWAIGVFFKEIKDHITDVSDAFAKMMSPNAVFSEEPGRRPSFSEMLSSQIFQQC